MHSSSSERTGAPSRATRPSESMAPDGAIPHPDTPSAKLIAMNKTTTYTKTDISQMRSVIRALACAPKGSLRWANAVRRAIVLERRIAKKESNGKK